MKNRFSSTVTHLVLTGALLCLVPGMAPAAEQAIRITSINSEYNPDHANTIDVHLGDVITLSADLFTVSDEGLVPQNRYVEEFIWSADDRAEDICNAEQEEDCLGKSNFEVNDYGVSFYVPYTNQEKITVYVQSSTDSSLWDQITLRNADYQPAYVPPTEIVTAPTEYKYNDYDSDHALAGQGRWIYISGTRYWVPYGYQTGWEPYRNGYWAWVDGDGWTWVSHDPWGWHTDHYGVWRHHGQYGWVWLPFEDHVYRPHVVTWIYEQDGAYVGWYPYHHAWQRGYRHGDLDGFDDGFWLGYEAGREFFAGRRYHHGLTVVTYQNFSHSNYRDVRITVEVSISGFFQRSYYGHRYGHHPGFDNDLPRSWEFMRIRVAQIHRTQRIDREFRNGHYYHPRPIFEIPGEYRRHIGPNRIVIIHPVGSIYDPYGRIIVPTRNHRGIALPPEIRGGQGNERRHLPPRARNRGVPDDRNGNYHPRPDHGPVAPPPIVRHGRDAWNPHPGNNGHNPPTIPPRRGDGPGRGNGGHNPPVPMPPRGGDNGRDHNPPVPIPPRGGDNDRGHNPPAPTPPRGGDNGRDRNPPAPVPPRGSDNGRDRNPPAPRPPRGGDNNGGGRSAPAPTPPRGGDSGRGRSAPTPTPPRSGGSGGRTSPAPTPPRGGTVGRGNGGGRSTPAPMPPRGGNSGRGSGPRGPRR